VEIAPFEDLKLGSFFRGDEHERESSPDKGLGMSFLWVLVELELRFSGGSDSVVIVVVVKS
jgi:hypothetical protein